MQVKLSKVQLKLELSWAKFSPSLFLLFLQNLWVKSAIIQREIRAHDDILNRLILQTYFYNDLWTNYVSLFLRAKTLTNTGCPKKRGISECCSVCSTAQLMLDLESAFLIHLKIEIHMFVPSTKIFLSDISERRRRFDKFPFWHILFASSQSSIITILHRLTSTYLTIGPMLKE